MDKATEDLLIRLGSALAAIIMDRVYRKDFTPLTEEHIRAEIQKLKRLPDLPTDEKPKPTPNKKKYNTEDYDEQD